MITVVHRGFVRYVVRDIRKKVSPTDAFYALGDLPPNHPMPVPTIYIRSFGSSLVWHNDPSRYHKRRRMRRQWKEED